MKLGTAMAANRAIIATTIMISTKVKPARRFCSVWVIGLWVSLLDLTPLRTITHRNHTSNWGQESSFSIIAPVAPVAPVAPYSPCPRIRKSEHPVTTMALETSHNSQGLSKNSPLILQRSVYLGWPGERMRLACWCGRLARTNFAFRPKEDGRATSLALFPAQPHINDNLLARC